MEGNNAKTGQIDTRAIANAGNNHHANVNGNIHSNTGNGRQQR